MITQSYKLNIVPYAEQTVRGMTSPKVPVSQYDKGLRVLVFDLYDGANGRLTLLAGQTAKIYGKKPDANVFEYDMTISEDRKSVSIVLQEQMAVIAGCVECEVRIFQGVSTIGSANFTLIVEPAPVGADEVYSESEIPEIDNLLYGGTAGQVFTKTPTGAHWADLGTSSDFMLKSVYDPNDDGSVLKADHADDAGTVDGHTVARNVLADEYTNAQIDGLIEQVGKVKTVNTVQPDQNGNVQIGKSDIGLGNVDNTSDASKPISTATQAALDLKVDKVDGKGLSTNDYTDADKTKLGDLPTAAELTADLSGKVDKETGKGLSTNDFTDAEKTKLQGIEAGAQVNTVTGVKGDAETDYRTGNINITKTNLGLSNVDNTSDLNKPISTATQTALDGKVDKVTGKGLSENDYTTAEKEKLAGIASGAEVNVQSNWNESDSSADSYIQNKPSIPTKTSDLTNDSGYITGVNWGAIGGTLADQIDLNNELSALNTGLSSAVKSVNTETPDANGNVAIKAENIPAQGYGNESTSGNPIIITDGTSSTVKNLDVSLEPIQDLHGYDNPWVGGAGKNLWNPSADWVGRYTTDNFTVTFSNNTITVTGLGGGSRFIEFLFPVESGATYVVSGTGNSSMMYKFYSEKPSTSMVYSGTTFIFGTQLVATGTWLGIQFENENGVTVQNPQLEKASSSTAYAPYSNICPISGRTEANVLRTGFNQWDEKWEVGAYNGSNGEKVSVSGRIRSKNKIHVIPLASYYIKTSLTLQLYQYDKSGKFGGVVSASNGVIYTVPSNIHYLAFNTSANSGETYNHDICINISKTTGTPKNGDYEPYSGSTATISLTSAGTVYGGTLDFDTGVLTVDRTVLNGDELNWGFNKNTFDGESTVAYVAITPALYEDGIGLCSGLKYTSNSSLDWGYFDKNSFSVVGGGSTNYIAAIIPQPSMTAAQIKQWMTDNSIIFCLKLKTPQTYQLTPAQLALLEGYNILTTDGDTINLRYIGTEASDVQAEIDEFEVAIHALSESVAPEETSPATATHATGTYLMYQNRLYKVIASIAVGETLTVGTNIQATTIMAELLALTA